MILIYMKYDLIQSSLKILVPLFRVIFNFFLPYFFAFISFHSAFFLYFHLIVIGSQKSFGHRLNLKS